MNAQAPAPDLGADGLAAQARKWVERPIAQPGPTHARTHILWVRMYRDECALDRLNSRTDQWRIPDRSWRAGMMFRGKWLLCRHASPVTAGYGERVQGRGQQDMQATRSDARAQLDAVARELTQLEWAAIAAVCGEDENAKGRWVYLDRGLAKLADWWNVPDDFSRWRMLKVRED